jgi:transmembrane sensor
MSEDREMLPLADAKDAKTRAAAWLERRDRADWSESDQAELDKWLAQSPGNLLAYWRVEAAWDNTNRLIAVRPFERRPPAPDTRGKWISALVKLVAGCAAIAVLGGGFLLFTPRAKEQSYTTPIGGHEVVSLADGSQIELNTDTVVRTDVSPDHRFAAIDKGEAYFHVTHNAQRPFRVFAGNRTVTDLGTRFSVRRDSERFEVAVMEGKVAFDPGKEQEKPIALLPGDVVVATATKVSLTKKPSRALAESLGWQRGLLIFDNTTLADAAAEFNRYNGEKLIVAKSAAHLPVVGTFRSNDVEAFARVTKEVFGLRFERHGAQIVIAR